MAASSTSKTLTSTSLTSSSSSSSSSTSSSKPPRTTSPPSPRAQRKRMRKKKLKEDATRPNQIIGPLLPSTIGEGENCTPDARRNAFEKPSDDPPQPGCSSQKNKVKERRKANKLAREKEQH